MGVLNRRKFCECGCKKVVKRKQRFIKGHHRRNAKASQSTRDKQSKAKQGKTTSRKGKTMEQIYGEDRAKEIKIKISIKLTGIKPSEESNKKRSKTLSGKTFSKEHNDHVAEGTRKSWQNPEFREKQSIAKKKPEYHKSLSKKLKDLWEDPKYIYKTLSGHQDDPRFQINKSETFLLNLLEEIYPGEWKFTGNYSIIIGRKSPDFMNISEKYSGRKLIELFGDYWHKGKDPQDRIDLFTPYGYDTLVIWEHELNDTSKVKKKLLLLWRKNLKEGINIKSLDCIMIAGGGKSELTLLQTVGRGFRRDTNKEEILIIDFLDSSRYLAEHCIERLGVYIENGWI